MTEPAAPCSLRHARPSASSGSCASTALPITDSGTRHFHRMADRPFAGALLAGLVEDHIHQRLSGFRIFPLENLRSDLDQERVQLPLVPLAEDLRKFLRARIDAPP